MRLWLLSWWWLLLASVVLASPGDRLKRFKRCVRECNGVNCHSSGTSEWEFVPFNTNLEYLYWNCNQDCDYQCQRIITAERKQNHRKLVQFHGKWAFTRIFGIQELVSTIFSIGNLVPHVAGGLKVWKELKNSNTYELKCQLSVILTSSIITCFAWLFSTIFHIRDVKMTEKLDYYFAGLTVLLGLYNVTVRLFKLYVPNNFNSFVSVTVLYASLYVAHVYRLVTDWLYTYNMQANITVAVIQNLFMGILTYNLYSEYYYSKKDHVTHLKYTGSILIPSFFHRSDKLFSLYPTLLATIVIIGMSLEIFDFPPVLYDLIDAHSLWHLVTIIPVVYGWYDWLIWDARENLTLKIKQK